jgi:hypothetical protein
MMKYLSLLALHYTAYLIALSKMELKYVGPSNLQVGQGLRIGLYYSFDLVDIGIISISVEGKTMICNLRGLKGWEIDFGSKAIKWERTCPNRNR